MNADNNVLDALKQHLSVMERGANHTALKLAIREIEYRQQREEKLLGLIENIHLHYNPGMPGFDVEAALSA